MALHGGPQIGFGQVRHTRLQPARHAFAYATYFLMLPMHRLAQDGGPLARNRFAPLSFYDCDHGDGRGPAQGGALAWLLAKCGSRKPQAKGAISKAAMPNTPSASCQPRVLMR